ncbi:MAG: hypothetical protein AMJ46_10370 [Latescibacteria bacterium DG_63]|nr:MAG: hypothetical protein AMJ46_10370 [Latescibacteria bacterium DG_63]
MKSNGSDSVHFYKASGAGNHFVLLDVTRGNPAMRKRTLVRALCVNAFSVGADGVIFIQRSPRAHFKVTYYNADGHEASMCGNGVRCAARFAFEKHLAPARMKIETPRGVLEAHVKRGTVEAQMGRPSGLKQNVTVSTSSGKVVGDVVDTGVPHFVTSVKRWKNLDVNRLGREIRLHSTFRPHGVNVDFVKRTTDGTLLVRTYERGVEAETLACGTGAVAAAVCLAERGHVGSQVKVLTRGGDTLTVRFKDKSNPLGNIQLEGPAQVVYEGDIALSVLREISRRPDLTS